MKTKTIVTAVLLGFVVVSAGWLMVGPGPAPKTVAEPNAPLAEGTTTSGPASSSTTDGQDGVSPLPDRVIVYYFHTTNRCPTCHKIENYTREAVESGFSKALSDGRLEFQALNVDEPANAHFIEDFQLSAKSVVVVDVKDGKQVQWKNLTKVWELVGAKDGFLKYVRDEINLYLQGK